MKPPIRLLVDSFADANEFNAQMINGREIMCRLDSSRFHVTTFCTGEPEPRLVQRPETRLIHLPERRQTVRILREFVWGGHDILFYVKPSPAAKLYLAWRRMWFDHRPVIGTVESQSDFYNEPTMRPEQIHAWEQTILRSDFLFSNSSSVRTSLEKEYGRESEVVATGVDTKFFTPAWDRPANRRVRVLFVGSLRPFKGPQLMLRAALRFPIADFVIAGDGMMAAELEDEVREKKIANVSFAGRLVHSRLLPQYQQADIFLFPSKWEGSPKVILEAAACGLPVIARKDYLPETVVNGETGLLGGSDDELLEQLGRLLANSGLRRAMGRASRALSERFDWDPITRRWEEVFVRVAGRRTEPARR